MTQEHERSKVAVQCTVCSAIYTAWTANEDSFRLIGTDECQCGEDEFQLLS
ncbi:hypothetical protein [Natronococcus wangiae]|uniref:hypothetical protein n=1 Tax=Natronococcus wangiae TaxID=3068275 RepID=UPI00273F6BEC|nr:hypothetical protein [Natronococcus sp. AD5]